MSHLLRVAQLIYTRVEAAYSPQRKSGYQTICRSASLSPAELTAIEQRVQCFQQQNNIVRRQCFRLSSGKVVLSQTTLLTSPNTTIIDSSGRTGAFIAHCLVLTATQYAELGAMPFAVFDHYPFQHEPQAMLQFIGRTADDDYHVQLEVVPPGVPARTVWSIGEARKLVALALQAEQLSSRGQSLLMVGDETKIHAALQLAFALMPPDIRKTCSFDTCIDRCVPRAGLYWLVGALKRPSSGSYIEVDLAGQRLSSTPELSDRRDLYLSWLRSVDAATPTDSALLASAQTFQKLARAFNERSSCVGEQLDAQACADFVRRYQPLIVERLRAALRAWLAGRLLVQLVNDMIETMVRENDQELLGVAACQSITAQKLGEYMLSWINQMAPPLKDGDWKQVLALLIRGRAIAQLDLLEPYILRLDDAGLSALEKVSKQTPDIPGRCWAAMHQRRDQLGPKAGLFSRLRRG